jgi:hypothetical protein
VETETPQRRRRRRRTDGIYDAATTVNAIAVWRFISYHHVLPSISLVVGSGLDFACSAADPSLQLWR